ncbi:MAG: 4-hydroxy-tetrahydrodipicolinate synthase [Acidimicrobiales bacterium]
MARVSRFGRLATAMVTPFDEQGAFSGGDAVELGRHLQSTGSEALVLAGTTGESPVLSRAEKIELWQSVTEAVTIPVIAGSTTNDTACSIELTREAQAAGVAGILAVTPYYSRPSQSGLARHFAAIAEATSLPVMLYDIPIRTGRKITTDTMVRLAREQPNVLAVKDASGDPAGTARLVAEAPAGFEIYSGDDSLTLPLLSIGAVGLVSVASHWIGPELSEMINRYLEGDVDGAAGMNAQLIDLVAFQSSDEAPNPMPAKAILRAAGWHVGECRLPNGPAPGWLEERAEALLADLESWRAGRRPEPVEP